MNEIIIAGRFCGPPRMGNGGYVCGVLAQRFDQAVEVTLHRPAPLDQSLSLIQLPEAGVALRDGDHLIAEAHPAQLDLEIPNPPTYIKAQQATAHYPVEHHPFPHCFVCGPRRLEGNGLRIFPSPISELQLVAATWTPDVSLADDTGLVRPEFIWAALDCPGGAAVVATQPRPILLGQLTGKIKKRVQPGERGVVIGWVIAHEGRKHITGTALFTEARGLCGYARAVWIEPKGNI